MRFTSLFLIVFATLCACQEEKPLRQRIGDSAPSDRWIYDDWDAAKDRATNTGKPILVVFRCVP